MFVGLMPVSSEHDSVGVLGFACTITIILVTFSSKVHPDGILTIIIWLKLVSCQIGLKERLKIAKATVYKFRDFDLTIVSSLHKKMDTYGQFYWSRDFCVKICRACHYRQVNVCLLDYLAEANWSKQVSPHSVMGVNYCLDKNIQLRACLCFCLDSMFCLKIIYILNQFRKWYFIRIDD